MKLYFIILFLILLFLLRFHLFSQEQKAFIDNQHISFRARLTAEPEDRGKVQAFSLRPDGYEPVYIRAPLYPQYGYGQILTVSGIVTLSEGEKKTFATMGYPEITVAENDSLLYGLIAFVRSTVTELFTGALPETSASLLMGIVFGIKQGMPEEFKDALRQVGVFHVVAASGMNVTLVAGAFMGIFGLFLKRQAALILSIMGIFFYAVLAGLEPSIVRASIMGSIIFISGILGRQNFALWTLALTGYLMLFWDPGLLTDIGFQLSFLATLGILVVKPVLPQLFGGMNRSEKSEKSQNDNMVIEDVKTTLAAQLATLPVLLSAFGQVSFLSVIANMFVLWTIPVLMVIGSVAAITGFVFVPLGKLIVYLALPFLLYFEWVVLVFARFDWMLKVEEFPWQGAVGYYLLLFSLILWQKKRITNHESRNKNADAKEALSLRGGTTKQSRTDEIAALPSVARNDKEV
jgi:ComEC/Rec2-related protein